MVVPRNGTTTSVLIVLLGLACYSVFAGLHSFLGLHHALSPSPPQQDSSGQLSGTSKSVPPKACRGKEPVLSLLEQPKACQIDTSQEMTQKTSRRHVLGMTTCNVHDMCQQIPAWKQLQKAYGKNPIVMKTQESATLQDVPIRVVGLPRTTSAVANVLRHGHQDRKITEQLWSSKDHKDEDVTTVCVIRDPFRWMADMVRCISIMFCATVNLPSLNWQLTLFYLVPQTSRFSPLDHSSPTLPQPRSRSQRSHPRPDSITNVHGAVYNHNVRQSRGSLGRLRTHSSVAV